MRTDIMSAMIGAATLAEELSASRRKQITLRLTPEGVRVEGAFLADAGGVLDQLTFLVNWKQLDGGRPDLSETVRIVDPRLTERWRADSAGAVLFTPEARVEVPGRGTVFVGANPFLGSRKDVYGQHIVVDRIKYQVTGIEWTAGDDRVGLVVREVGPMDLIGTSAH